MKKYYYHVFYQFKEAQEHLSGYGYSDLILDYKINTFATIKKVSDFIVSENEQLKGASIFIVSWKRLKG